MARILTQVNTELPELIFSFADHRRRAKRRNLGIMNAKNAEERKKLYRDLVAVTENTYDTVNNVCERSSPLGRLPWRHMFLEAYALMGWAREQLETFPLARQVVCQTRRRVFEGESVSAQEKIVSIFEPHTDIIRKDRRDTYYGHKICLTGGVSNLILDCVVLEGNPADSDLTEMMLDRQNRIYGRYPLKATFDGGFASKENLERAREKGGLKDVCFSRRRGLAVEDMCRSNWVYKNSCRISGPVLNQGFPGSNGASALIDVPGKALSPSRVMCGLQSCQPTC